jgi:hypothetical protein
MILSRAWYVLLGVAVGVALYTVFVAVGQYNRQSALALKEGLASDSQTVEWALKIDARRRLDALLPGSVDANLQQALVAANASKDGKGVDKARADAKKALNAINEAIAADWRDDALLAVDRDGHVVAEFGYDIVAGNEDFELGGYPAVNDALHGWERDDAWILGSKMYIVVARPVEYDVTQRPAGAIVGLKEVSNKLAEGVAKRTRTNVAFYTTAGRAAGGVGVEGFDPEKLDAVGSDLKSLADKAYGVSGRSEVRMLSDDLGAMYARLPGDAWPLGGGFAVVRSKTSLAGPMGFLSGADDKDKANVPWILLAGVAIAAALIGLVFTWFEHTTPLRELVMQAERLKAGGMDGLQVARFRGAYRLAAQNLNQGMERSIEKAGGVTRRPADLESILGPTPAQPSMSAFSFPLADGAAAGGAPVPTVPPATASGGFAAVNSPPRPSGSPAKAPPPLVSAPAIIAAPIPAAGARPQAGPPGRPGPPPPLARSAPSLPSPTADEPDDEATMVGAVPAELLAQATGENRGATEETTEWVSTYEDFIRTKKQCGEPTDGLTFEKFSQTLRKNRDQLMARHACKRVKFSVYVKDGRASLKATPVKE